ncbi:hypothetical protein DPMN_181910 [Dreissena polymorpha]|uniref:Uncharacterized protein n=1 Tax=Dreissena polymorpha TaxID=45954 RepID=A0A9D4DEF9_DREPO|nr:hypothetical protein DPMN_181910 [Dreissena polymorpha]
MSTLVHMDLVIICVFPDEHCRFLVEHGVIQRLLRLLKPTYGEAKCTLEHAALSALRNLAIPGRCTLEHAALSALRNLAIPGRCTVQ